MNINKGEKYNWNMFSLAKFIVILLSLCLSCRIYDVNANVNENFADDAETG